MYGPKYKEIIVDICNKNQLKYKLYDDDLIMLNYNGKKKYIWSRRFPNNNNSACRIIDSKSLCSTVLSDNNIPVVTHIKLCRPNIEKYDLQIKSNYKVCIDLLNQYGKVVIKPDNSCEGTNVYFCQTEKEIETALEKVFINYKFAATSMFINIVNEYRVFYLDGEILYIYKKERPYVIGDGKSTLVELLVNARISKIDFKNILLPLDFVPKKDEKCVLSMKHNLSQGGIAKPIKSSNLIETLSKIAVSAGNAVDANFVTVDIIEDDKHQLKVLEINSGVAMDQFILQHIDGYNIAYKIYENAIKKLY